MRFGKTLQKTVYPPWKDYYIDYTKLKKLLRDDESAASSPVGRRDDSWTDKDAEDFYAELTNVQLEKVQNFHKETYQKLRDRTSKCEAKLDPIAASVKGEDEGDKAQSNGQGKKPVPSEEEQKKILKEVLEELDDITKETNELEKYSRINYTGFLKIAKKHDRKRGGRVSVRGPLQSLLVKVPFNKEDYSPLLYRLSAMYSFVQQQLNGKERGMSMADSQLIGETYRSRKFWVHKDNILEVKTVILRRLPVLVYNPKTSKIAEASQRDPTLTSIYFDNPNFSLYSGKVEHKGDASSLRLRWYGQLAEKPEIQVEKKTVKEDDSSEEERFTIKEKYVQPFINSDYKMEKTIKKVEARAGQDSNEANSLRKSVDDISAFIKENDLQPVLRANYVRTAFQIPGDDRIRVSLDTDLAFIREDAVDPDRPCRDPEDWHRRDIDDREMEYPFDQIRKGEVDRFKHAVLEIKTKGQKNHEWINDLINSHLVKEAPRFSKFVHGCAKLFDDNVNVFPFWLSAVDEDIRQEPEDAFKEEQAKKQQQADDETAVGSFINKRSTPPSKAGALSPVGSPSAKVSSMERASPEVSRSKSLGTSARAHPTGVENTVEEADSDDDGPQAHGTQIAQPSTMSNLKSLFPSFSNSKYAQRQRRGRDAPLPPGVQKPEYWIKDQGEVKVEAKVWLANQRTFIKWQHVSVLLASLSLGLYNAAGANNNVARALGVVYAILAVFIAAWGWGVYQWRSHLIQTRSGKDFDALTGPIVTCIGLVVALVLNFAFKYNQAMQDRQVSPSTLSYNESQVVLGMGEL